MREPRFTPPISNSMTGRSEVFQPLEEEVFLGRGELSVISSGWFVHNLFYCLKVEDDPDRPTYSRDAISLLQLSRMRHLKGCD